MTRAQRMRPAALWLALASLVLAVGCASDPPPEEEPRPEAGRIEPTYQPREPEPEPFYNTDYLFPMTRGIADSTIHPAGKGPLFVLSVPLDIAFLPFGIIGGFF